MHRLTDSFRQRWLSLVLKLILICKGSEIRKVSVKAKWIFLSSMKWNDEGQWKLWLNEFAHLAYDAIFFCCSSPAHPKHFGLELGFLENPHIFLTGDFNARIGKSVKTIETQAVSVLHKYKVRQLNDALKSREIKIVFYKANERRRWNWGKIKRCKRSYFFGGY